MPKTGWQDPGSSEVRSTHISGLQEAVGKIEDILDVQLQAETGIELSEVYIFEGDRYRIYQAPEGKRNWATSPAPVIKKNSVPISTGFTIDYGGGAVIFSTPLSGTDTVTADFSRTKTDGNKLAMLDAADVPYDNTESELTATDTQAAIDETVDMVKSHKAENANQHDEMKTENSAQHRILIRDILRMKLRQTGLNLDPNAWSDTLEDDSGIDTVVSDDYVLDSGKLSVPFVDVAVGGTPISGGDKDPWIASNAFDKGVGTYWEAKQIGVAMVDTAYIGYDFGPGKSFCITQFDYYGSSVSTSQIASASLQKSYDGVSWVEVELFTFSGTLEAQTKKVSAPGEPARYWRLLVRDRREAAYWRVFELILYIQNESTVIWKPQQSDGVIKTAIVEAVENLNGGSIEYYISRDGGTTFTQCQLDTPTDITSQPTGTSIVLKAVIKDGAELLAVAWGGEI